MNQEIKIKIIWTIKMMLFIPILYIAFMSIVSLLCDSWYGFWDGVPAAVAGSVFGIFTVWGLPLKDEEVVGS